MAQPFTTGPVNIYVAITLTDQTDPFAGGRQIAAIPAYLGTMLEAPKHRMTPKWSPVMNDIAGDQEPFDMAYQGQSTDIFGDLTVWNWPVLKACKSRPVMGTLDGFEPFGSVGTLMITEGFAYQLWLDYPYYRRKAAFADQGAPAGYHYFASWMVGPDEEDPGTKPNRIHVQFRCQRVYSPLNGSFSLYDHDMSAIPLFPPATSNGLP